jgi:hypothetical protein
LQRVVIFVVDIEPVARLSYGKAGAFIGDEGQLCVPGQRVRRFFLFYDGGRCDCFLDGGCDFFGDRFGGLFKWCRRCDGFRFCRCALFRRWGLFGYRSGFQFGEQRGEFDFGRFKLYQRGAKQQCGMNQQREADSQCDASCRQPECSSRRQDELLPQGFHG